MKPIRVLVLASIIAWAQIAIGNQVPEASFAERAARADLVVIGTAISIEDTTQSRVATVRVETVLKGPSLNQLRLQLTPNIAEFAPACCRVGERYLMFLEANRNASYSSVNGPFGIYRLDGLSAR